MKLYSSIPIRLLLALAVTSMQVQHHTVSAFTPLSFQNAIAKLATQQSEQKDLNPNLNFNLKDVTKDLTKKAIATTLGAAVLLSTSTPLLSSTSNPFIANAASNGGSREVGEIKASGIFFKDTLTVESFDDPKVQGVTLYISNFQRPLNERLQKDFFSDPSTASVGCAKTGPIAVADNIAIGKAGEEVFEENKSLLFKQLRVQVSYFLILLIVDRLCLFLLFFL
jgi:CreA protein